MTPPPEIVVTATAETIALAPGQTLTLTAKVERRAGYKGKVPIAEGVEAFLFERNGQGTLMLWDRGSAGSVKSLAVNLGDRPLRVDLWGNVTPLAAP